MLFLGCGDGAEEPPPLTIAAASSMRYVLPKITKEFTEITGMKCELIFSSSGKLAAQISAGAPYDLFLSADKKYPAALQKSGLTAGPPILYARGQLALWKPGLWMLRINELDTAGIRKIALPNPRVAPYGLAAVQALRSVGLYDTLRPKLVFGESVAQANQFVYSGAADIGFTAIAYVRGPNPEVKSPYFYTEVDTATYDPIYQSSVVIDLPDGRVEAARDFQRYLLSARGQDILGWYGYLPVR